MARPNRLYFPRLMLVMDTLLALSLTMTGVVLIQLPSGVLRVAGYAAFALSVLVLLPCAREWLSPSYLELTGNAAVVKWNNWRLDAAVSSVDLPAKKPVRLVLRLADGKTRIEPVGPLFLLASWIIYPLIKPFSAPWRAPLYPVSAKQLDKMLGLAPDGSVEVSFATGIYGRRKLRRVVEQSTAGN